MYLAASSAVKVGVTRAEQVPTRWIDQGATSAIRLAEVPNRYEAGRIEVSLKEFFTDKTSWQRMLKNEIDESIDLEEEKWSLEDQLPQDIIDYFSEKVKSVGFDKVPTIQGKLMGIKGQYLIFEGGLVLNIRKHTGYYVEIN